MDLRYIDPPACLYPGGPNDDGDNEHDPATDAELDEQGEREDAARDEDEDSFYAERDEDEDPRNDGPRNYPTNDYGNSGP
jgi:hypothetical protein